MIEEIIFKNVLSFKKETTFSFEATPDTTFETQHVVTMPNGTRLLKLGIVYGPNAGEYRVCDRVIPQTGRELAAVDGRSADHGGGVPLYPHDQRIRRGSAAPSGGIALDRRRKVV